jgi:polyferredoxin
MAKIGKPRGLIDYFALKDEPRERIGLPPTPVWRHVLRPRTILYSSFWLGVGLALLFALFIRAEIDMTVAPVRNPVYITQSDGTIRNVYDVRLLNKHGEARNFHLSLTADSTLRIDIEGTDQRIVSVPADSTAQVRVYVSARPQDPANTATRTPLRFWVEDLETGERAYVDSIFNGKGS